MPALGTPWGRQRASIVPLVTIRLSLVLRDLVASTVQRGAYEVLTPTGQHRGGDRRRRPPRRTRGRTSPAADRRGGDRSRRARRSIDVDSSDTGRIYLHILHAERAAATAEHVVEQLAELACAALPDSRPDGRCRRDPRHRVLIAFGLTFVAAGDPGGDRPGLDRRSRRRARRRRRCRSWVPWHGRRRPTPDPCDSVTSRTSSVMAIVGFTATVAASRFIEHQRGRPK